MTRLGGIGQRLTARRIRAVLMTAAAITIALPATATANPRDGDADQIVRTLENPATQDAMARMVAVLTRAMMALPVGPLAQAMDDIDPDGARSDIPADATMADLAGVDSDEMADQLAGQTRRSTAMMATMARTMATMAPVLGDMARDMAAQMERSVREAR